jgi:hypothetical protein
MCCKLTVLWVRIPESGQVSQFFAWSTILLAAIHGIIARSFSPTCSMPSGEWNTYKIFILSLIGDRERII